MKQIVTIIAEIGKIETLEDGLKIVVYTNEVSPEDMATMMQLRGKQGNMLFSTIERKFVNDDLKDLPEPEVEKGERTPSQRLRAVIYRLWEQVDPQKKTTFENYYRSYMERLVDSIKEKLT